MAAKIFFPDPETADSDGLLAAGGNLEVDTLLTAYSMGIFPWYNENSPILWWSPDPRLVLFPDCLKVSKSLRQKINQNRFQVKFDTNFEEVIGLCSDVNLRRHKGTWLTGEMINAYICLHKTGYAHSVESYFEGRLAGGLYGVSIGKVFFGESMFYLKTDASKVALYFLVELLKKMDFDFIDAQQSTSHMRRLGAEEIKRSEFLKMLKKGILYPTRVGSWDIL